jgi:hypothetical protein
MTIRATNTPSVSPLQQALQAVDEEVPEPLSEMEPEALNGDPVATRKLPSKQDEPPQPSPHPYAGRPPPGSLLNVRA